MPGNNKDDKLRLLERRKEILETRIAEMEAKKPLRGEAIQPIIDNRKEALEILNKLIEEEKK